MRADDVTIRPMRPQDAAPAFAASRIALDALYPRDDHEDEAIRIAGGTRRLAHCLHTDPGGCWVAESDGRVVGAAVAIIREGVWGLGLLALLPGFQARGIGTRLYEPAHAYGADVPGGLILSSNHPAAMRRYARSPGFRLVPTVGLSGAWQPRRAPSELRSRPGDLDADAPTIDGASRHVRGASHMRDLRPLLDRPGAALLVIDGDGFACADNGAVLLLAARTEAGAADLLWGTMLSGPRGATVDHRFISADNGWAIDAGLEAGLSLNDCGPLFVRGDVGSMAPFLPSGPYL